MSNNVNIGMNFRDCDKCEKNSIAHKIARYFDLTSDEYERFMLFEYNKSKNKILVSKEILKYLLSMYSDIEILKNVDFELVDKIDFLKGE